MKKILLVPTLMLTWAYVVSAADVAPAVEELIPVVQGGARQIQQPAAVRNHSVDVIEAASAQDAVNAALSRQQDELTESRLSGTSTPADFVIFGSGIGAVSTGRAVFREHDDITAARIDKREAYVTAYQRAKGNLLKLLRSPDLEKNQEIKTRIHRATDGKNSGVDQTQVSSQLIESRVSGMLRGYIVFSVQDEPSQSDRSVHEVFVTLAATPMTMARAKRVSAVQIQADSLQSGLQQLMVELQQGLVPPIGARVIDVPAAGEKAFVGFGSAVLMEDEPAAQILLGNDSAEEAAKLFGYQSLMELLQGDEITWQGRTRSRQQQTYRSFEPMVNADPLQPVEPQQVQKLKEVQQKFLAEFEQEEVIQAVGRGKLPIGTITRTWRDKDQGWAFGIVTYIPSATVTAAEIIRQMDQSVLDDGPAGSASNPGPSSQPSEMLPTERRRAPLPPGPSGRLDRKKL